MKWIWTIIALIVAPIALIAVPIALIVTLVVWLGTGYIEASGEDWGYWGVRLPVCGFVGAGVTLILINIWKRRGMKEVSKRK